MELEPTQFHDFRVAPSAVNLAYHPPYRASSFWQQDLVPQVSSGGDEAERALAAFSSAHQAFGRHQFPAYFAGPDVSEVALVPVEPLGLVPSGYDHLPALERTLDSFLAENGNWMFPVYPKP
jgi:hypothetical protein